MNNKEIKILSKISKAEESKQIEYQFEINVA